MIIAVEYFFNKASAEEIAEHLFHCDASFVPPLSDRVKIKDYAKKIISKAMRFEAWSGGLLVGLVAVYCNQKENGNAFITSVSVKRDWIGKGIATKLMVQCFAYLKRSGMWQINLEVARDNIFAINLYTKNGFVAGKINDVFIEMNLRLKNREEHEE